MGLPWSLSHRWLINMDLEDYPIDALKDAREAFQRSIGLLQAGIDNHKRMISVLEGNIEKWRAEVELLDKSIADAVPTLG
jgi:hypothetical protein